MPFVALQSDRPGGGEIKPAVWTISQDDREVRKRFFILQSQVKTIENFVNDIDRPLTNPEGLFYFYYNQAIRGWLIEAINDIDPEIADTCTENMEEFDKLNWQQDEKSAEFKVADKEKFKVYKENIRKTLLTRLTSICAYKLSKSAPWKG